VVGALAMWLQLEDIMSSDVPGRAGLTSPGLGLAGLPEGAVIAPVILASDKTMLSQFRGDKQALPV